jgi:hypothetical protein
LKPGAEVGLSLHSEDLHFFGEDGYAVT